VEYSTKVGYNADQMAGFFKTLQALSGEGGSIPSFLSTHPDPGDRFVNVGKYADEVQAKSGLDDTQLKVNRDNYLRMIDGLVYGEDPRQGYFENNNFYHPELKFQFPVPAGWKTINTPAQVQMAPADGKGLMTLGVASGNSLTEAANAIVQENQLTVLDKTNTTVNGLQAISMLSQQTSPAANGQPATTLKILTYLIQYNGMIYKMHGMANTTDFNRYYNNYMATMKGFRELTDPSKLNRMPSQIKVVSVKSTGTLQSALNAYNVSSKQLSELALINGMALNDQVNAGTLIKILTAGTMAATENSPNVPNSTNTETPKTPDTTTEKPTKTVIDTKVKKPTKVKN
jgi:predicted Zn-dependent protease